LQIGDPSVIANITGITTIGDFRIADCASGGSGAPLVSYMDFILFRSNKLSRGLLNIGGISNITLLSKGCSKDEVIAFDTGPGNMLIDGLMKKLYNKPYDKNGKAALKGKLNKKLFSLLKNDKYYKMVPPKSTGREHYSERSIQKIIKAAVRIPYEDIIRTVSEFTVHTIAYNYDKFIKPVSKIDELIISGGGANNSFLRKRLTDSFPGVKIKTMDYSGITQDSKEAVLFAILGFECLKGNPANMKQVTGSKKDAILGKICQG
jgi:anhydro-N-acetylmuramic acid kinase